MSRGGWIGVDLDGTLAYYDGWKGHTHIGVPIMPMLERVRAWLGEGREVRIFTARYSRPDPEREEFLEAMSAWCLEHIGQDLRVTATKDLMMIECWDDRAKQVVPNVGIPVSRYEYTGTSDS